MPGDELVDEKQEQPKCNKNKADVIIGCADLDPHGMVIAICPGLCKFIG